MNCSSDNVMEKYIEAIKWNEIDQNVKSFF